ncbi:MAG: NepR family anti-sigma factor, partial [Hyphomonadaceae bacterium]|nr:NepR family anti-sigma factor [Hyphomonadaceae bacterium]
MGKDNSGGDAGAKPVDARVARRRQDPIGRRLRQMYDEVVNEDVPDDFLS